MAQDPKTERSFIIVKPDGVQRSLVGEIISRIEATGLKITALKMIMATEDQCWTHYNKDDAWFLKKGTGIAEEFTKQGLPVTKEPMEYGKDIVRQLVDFMTCGPVVCMIVEGNAAVSVVTKLVGTTEPITAGVGTIRGDFSLDSYALAGVAGRAVRNIIHCSDKPEEAEREIKIWFNDSEIIKYNSNQEHILYDMNLDSIKN